MIYDLIPYPEYRDSGDDGGRARDWALGKLRIKNGLPTGKEAYKLRGL
ncbi:MAG: hypothetical protein KatS3mg111_3281 [Pirellulaceae bacterium]|nr:MAG: hypothetical protein KatS3mg111_3281 [Pirellulaceae bacterium]